MRDINQKPRIHRARPFRGLKAVLFVAGLIALCGCEVPPAAEPISTAEKTSELLTTNGWFLTDLLIEVDKAPLPLGILAGAASENGGQTSGTFNVIDIIKDLNPTFGPLPILFTTDKIVLEDQSRLGVYEDLGSRYNPLDGEYMMFGMRDTPNLLYTYRYQVKKEIFGMEAEDVDAQKTVQALNALLQKALTGEVPDAAAGAVVDKLYENEQIRAAIDEALTDILSARIEGRPELIDDPQAAAASLVALLIAAGATPPGVNIKNLTEALVAVILEVQQAVEDGTDDIVDVLVEALINLGSDFINTALPPEELARRISLALYQKIETRLGLLNSVRSVKIDLKKGAAHGN